VARPVLPGLLIAAGGALTVLAGLVEWGPALAAGEAGVAVGGMIVLLGFLVPLAPGRKTYFAFGALVFAVLSIFFAYAGFIVGFFLVLLGAMMAYVWVPPTAAPRPAAGARRPSGP